MAVSENALVYKDKVFARCGNEIYYGTPEDRFIVIFKIKETEKFQDLDIAKRVIVELRTNDCDNPKLIKQAERDTLYKAIDIGLFWLDDAITNH